MARFLLIILCLTAGGCGPSIQQQVHQGFGQASNAQTRLLVAVAAYQLGSGHWPASPEDLRRSSALNELVDLERFQNLRFEPWKERGLLIRFDRWTSPDGTARMEKSAIAVGPPAD